MKYIFKDGPFYFTGFDEGWPREQEIDYVKVRDITLSE